MKILVVLPVEHQHKEIFKRAAGDAEVIFCSEPSEYKAVLRDVDAVIGNVPVEMLRGCEQLRWIQLNNAGTEGFCEPGALPETTVITNATGAYGLAISEFMLGMLLMLYKHLDHYYDQQKAQIWGRIEPGKGTDPMISGSTTLVIGLGDIGTTFARKMDALGSKVIGIRKSAAPKPEFVQEQYTMDALPDIIGQADIVAMSLPGYAQTRHVINKDMLKLMKKNAVLINVGRGMSVDSMALCEALHEGRIAGACLDVTEPEPLPPDHPLWSAPHVLITPHASGGFAVEATLEKVVALSAGNVARFVKGEALENVVDRSTGYVRR